VRYRHSYRPISATAPPPGLTAAGYKPAEPGGQNGRTGLDVLPESGVEIEQQTVAEFEKLAHHGGIELVKAPQFLVALIADPNLHGRFA